MEVFQPLIDSECTDPIYLNYIGTNDDFLRWIGKYRDVTDPFNVGSSSVHYYYNNFVLPVKFVQSRQVADFVLTLKGIPFSSMRFLFGKKRVLYHLGN